MLLWAEFRGGPLTPEAVSIFAARAGLSPDRLANALEALAEAKLIPLQGYAHLIGRS